MFLKTHLENISHCWSIRDPERLSDSLRLTQRFQGRIGAQPQAKRLSSSPHPTPVLTLSSHSIAQTMKSHRVIKNGWTPPDKYFLLWFLFHPTYYSILTLNLSNKSKQFLVCPKQNILRYWPLAERWDVMKFSRLWFGVVERLRAQPLVDTDRPDPYLALSLTC